MWLLLKQFGLLLFCFAAVILGYAGNCAQCCFINVRYDLHIQVSNVMLIHTLIGPLSEQQGNVYPAS